MPYKNGNATDGADGVLLSTNGNKVVIVGGNNQTGEKEWIPLDNDGRPGEEANGGGVIDAFRRRASSLNIGRGSHHGFSLGIAIIFIIGECAGSGVLALPKAMADMGWTSVFVMVVCCLASSYSGVFLAKCWIIVEERYEEYRGKTRNPYPAIGEIAIGKWMSYLVSFSVNFTLFGVSVVYLLLCAQTFQSMLKDYVDYSFCIWILIFGAILCPLMWLGTPEDFWPSALLALLTTAIACVLLLVNIVMDGQELTEPAKFPAPTFSSFFLSFGTILFTFGGAAAFPTFQNDMKDKKKFPTAVIVGFLGLLFLYLPVSISGYAVFGGDVKENVVRSISDGPMKLTADILLAGHFFFAFLILINPTAQEIEDVFHVPKRFNYKRIIVRSMLMLTVVFVAETIPQFSKILSLVGGSTVTLTSYVFPAIFYMKLCSQTHPDWPERKCSVYEKIYLVISIILGAIGGAIATYSAISDIIRESSFSPPCYIPHHPLVVSNLTSFNDTDFSSTTEATGLLNSTFF